MVLKDIPERVSKMCLPEYPDIYEYKYMTLCGCHIRKCATYFTIFMIFVQLFFLPCEKEVIINITLIITHFFVIYADKAEKPWAYVPCLISTATFIVISVVAMEVTLIAGVNKVTDVSVEFTLLIVAGMFAILCFRIYQWILVYKARQYMIEQVVSRNVQKDVESQEPISA